MSYVLAISINNVNIFNKININFNQYLYTFEEIKDRLRLINNYLNKGVYKLKNNGVNDEFFKFCNCNNIIFIDNIEDIQLFNEYFYLNL